MERLSSYAVDPVAAQLALLNLLLFVHLVCKGVEYATRVFVRRDPPKKSIRSKLARSDES
ncbi:hypothetical protein BTM_1133 [Burkholderia thailandensis 34]|uniref:hypothetical protein n=1 Tax=Burkholderia TaxID=32008 RepID=UPI0005D8D0F1|nr:MULTISPECIES: hypothetical protein [Burkholderia]AJY29994.1 hypothetical protein BTM_1133 [Burkholderia thailandensis 34]AOJ55867.1 hypothetical protein AQ477_04605 [Burkholderia thailandensis]KXF60127.1 hypothetical protein AQ476_01715 [Burkholderia thailandensis]PNE75816.1 hypothetical protein A8H37_30200 [Burkholderia thailandensis]CAG9232343.1 conserved hypothetical protein [Burkholderia vietnamiensis]